MNPILHGKSVLNNFRDIGTYGVTVSFMDEKMSQHGRFYGVFA
jgi:hypothetical protein